MQCKIEVRVEVGQRKTKKRPAKENSVHRLHRAQKRADGQDRESAEEGP